MPAVIVGGGRGGAAAAGKGVVGGAAAEEAPNPLGLVQGLKVRLKTGLGCVLFLAYI